MDRYELSLVGLQQQLVEEIYATGVPTIVVLVNGRPLGTEWIAENIPALVEALGAPVHLADRLLRKFYTGK